MGRNYHASEYAMWFYSMALENRDIHDKHAPEEFLTEAGEREIDAAKTAIESAVADFAARYVAENPQDFTDPADAVAFLSSLDCVADAVHTVTGAGVGYWDGRIDHIFTDGNAGAKRYSDAATAGLAEAVRDFETALDNAVYDYETQNGLAV